MPAERDGSPRGRWIQAAGGYRAYMPGSLPPDIHWTPDLVAKLSAADHAVGRLAGEGRRLPNPHLMIRPFVRREAVLSSRIEGTETTLSELLAAEAGARVDRAEADLREVRNYVTALEYGLERLSDLPLSLRLVRELHAKLMRGVRGDSATPGEFRRSQNWIGPPGCSLNDATYVPLPPDRLMEALGEWEEFLHENTLPPLGLLGVAHAQFEAIHPFLDGNGRVGRLLITLMLVERDLLSSPLLYLSAYFEATRQEYYARLLAVTERGEWAEWLSYFLQGVALQAEDALGRIRRIDKLVAGWRGALSTSRSRTPEQALHLFTENPYWTIPSIAERLDVAYTTAQRAVERLEAEGIVEQRTEARRDRVYCATEILAILEEPANLR